MKLELEQSWKVHLEEEMNLPYFHDLNEYVRTEYSSQICYPPKELLFAAFDHCHFDNVKVVILGQDPYHGPRQANGLCFSVNDGCRIPPSLVNILKEVRNDTGKEIPHSGNLEVWADQGVLLLNATLSVRANLAGSHQKHGWERFTDAVVNQINKKKEHVVFLLWGNYAQKKGAIIDTNKHFVLKSAHPSPLSAYQGFFGGHHFTLANKYLSENGINEINW